MVAGKPYHLYTHANGFENLFRSQENYRYFLKRYEYFIPSVAHTLAYCLMPNHIHFLIRIKEEAEIIAKFQSSKVSSDAKANPGGLIEKRISQQFSNLFNTYTKAFNKMYARRGSLFIPNFKRKEITDDQYFTQLIHYIHANPVHHGFVKTMHDWPWSSFGALLNEEPTFVQRKEILNWFGNTEAFIGFHSSPITVRSELALDT